MHSVHRVQVATALHCNGFKLKLWAVWSVHIPETLMQEGTQVHTVCVQCTYVQPGSGTLVEVVHTLVKLSTLVKGGEYTGSVAPLRLAATLS